jgi:hypothetical protein
VTSPCPFSAMAQAQVEASMALARMAVMKKEPIEPSSASPQPNKKVKKEEHQPLHRHIQFEHGNTLSHLALSRRHSEQLFRLSFSPFFMNALADARSTAGLRGRVS